MQKGTRKTAETREMLRNTILEIKEKFRCNLHHELLSLRVNGKHIQGCIEQNPKKVLMPIYLPPGFYIVYHDVTVPNWMTCPAMEKLEKNMYWKASGISKCDDYSEVIPFSLASLQLRGYIFSLKCDDAIGILEIYPRKQPNSTPRSKTVKKDQPDKLELKMKKALTLSNNDNILQQQSTPTISKQLSKQQQQSSINTKHQSFQEQEQQLPIQLIKVENENDIDLCSLTSCTKRQREHANDPALVSFLEPQRSERKRVKIAKVMKENQSIIAAAPAPVPVTSAATFSFSSSSSAAANAAVAACFDGNPSTLSSSSCCLTNVARPPEEYDLSSFLSDIDTLETSNIPNIFEGIN